MYKCTFVSFALSILFVQNILGKSKLKKNIYSGAKFFVFIFSENVFCFCEYNFVLNSVFGIFFSVPAAALHGPDDLELTDSLPQVKAVAGLPHPVLVPQHQHHPQHWGNRLA